MCHKNWAISLIEQVILSDLICEAIWAEIKTLATIVALPAISWRNNMCVKFLPLLRLLVDRLLLFSLIIGEVNFTTNRSCSCIYLCFPQVSQRYIADNLASSEVLMNAVPIEFW